MLATMPSRTSWRAISAQSHCDNDRPLRSGRSQAILTACRATEGGKGGLPPASRPIVQALQASGEEALDPLADMLLSQADASRGPDQGSPVGDGQDRLAATGQSQGGGCAAEPVFEETTLLGGKDDH